MKMDTNINDMINEVIAVCNDLGHKNKLLDNKYILNKKDCHHVLKDLIRFLRSDNKTHFPVRTQLGTSDIVDNDLIPIVEQYCLEDIPLFDKILRLLIDLTNPVILLFRQTTPTDKSELQKFIELQEFLYLYKVSFGSHKRFWSVIAKHLTRIIELEAENRQVEDGLMFERILILIRNILHIPIDGQHMKAEVHTNPHDHLLQVLHSSGIADLILYLTNDDAHQEFCFHLIEIISLMFRDQSAEFIAKSVTNCQQNEQQRSDFEKEVDRKELKELKARDINNKIKVKPNLNRFNGTYSVKNMKSISDRDMICHKTPQDLTQLSFDVNKDIKRKNRFRKPMADESANKSAIGPQVIHKSTFTVRKILYDFCVDFITNSYNLFMKTIYENLSRNLNQENDETYYLWAIQFFMEFNRTNPKSSDSLLVTQTMTVTTFHFLTTQFERYIDFLKTQKENLSLWSKRLHYALKAYRELLFSMNWFSYNKDESIRSIAKQIKKYIFYEVEYRDLLLQLIGDYNESKMTKSYLKDLIETNHIFLKMLEHYYRSNTKIVVKEKIKKSKRKKSQKKKNDSKIPPEDVWNEIISIVSEALSGSLDLPSPQENVEIRAFDSISGKKIEEQKGDVMQRIHNFLYEKRVVEAVSLYRDARSCWAGDEDNAFGSQDILPEDELISLNEILMTDFPNEPSVEEVNNDEEIEEKDIEDNESRTQIREREIEFTEVINKYCRPNVITNYCLLLRHFDSNTDETNHCILKMLHRIAFDSKMHAMLCQVSLFRTLQRILSDPIRDSSALNELKKFAKFIVMKFVGIANKNKKVFMEIFFWKNCNEAYQVEEGYTESRGTKVAKQLWTEEQEHELTVLFEEYKDKCEGDKDYIDFILEHMIDDTKTRRQVIKQLKQQGLFIPLKAKRTSTKRSKNKSENPFDELRSDEESDEDMNDNLNTNYNNEEINHHLNEYNKDDNEVNDVNSEIVKSLEDEVSEDNDDNHNRDNEEISEKRENEKMKSKDSIDIYRKIKRKRLISDSSESSSDELPVLTIDELSTTDGIKRTIDDSDDEVVVKPKNKKRHLIIDDEEDE
ncbi:protein timeless homolog [Oppia nitens]|uniref:protein timeless homolog n=1 Tax=Oppia nitens TaxID=1686743 RepID=UPI0023D97B89|nr:protein timeless homolog [Oppia nitens]